MWGLDAMGEILWPLQVIASSARVGFGLGEVSQPPNATVLVSTRPQGAMFCLGGALSWGRTGTRHMWSTRVQSFSGVKELGHRHQRGQW